MAREQAYERFGPFLIVRPLGRGGMGEVYIARTPWEESPLAAVKRLRPDVARVPTFAERFKHEADLAVRLEHPNVVGTIHVGSVDSQLYVASQLILGKDTGFIADRLRERGLGAPVAVVIRLLHDILSGLSYVHGVRDDEGRHLGLIHRDVTPGNVLVSYDGTARLADFGLAKSALQEGGRLTQHGEILGTPHYLAPEIIRGEKAGASADLYGLGAVMYRVLTGVAPHQGTTAEVLFKALNEKPRNLLDLRPDLPKWFAEFVHAMLEQSVKVRPADAGLLARRLEHNASGAKLLLQPSSVGRWLGQLFEEERKEEIAEEAELLEVDPGHHSDAVEGTVVLARVRPGTALQPPIPVANPEELDAPNTDLDLPGADLLGDEPGPEDLRTWAIPFDGQLDEQPAVSFEPDQEGTHFDTKAVPQERPISTSSLEDSSESFGLSTADSGVNVASELPGFLDGEDSIDTGSEEIADDESDEMLTAVTQYPPGSIVSHRNGKGRRPRNPNSVIVGPAAKGSIPPQAVPVHDESVSPPTDRAPPPAPSPPPYKEREREREREPRPERDRPERDRARPKGSIPPPDRRVGARHQRKMPLVALLISSFLFAAAGVGIGFIISNRNLGVKAEIDTKSLRARFTVVQAELDQRRSSGRPIAPKTVETRLEAAEALLEGNSARAEKAIVELEKIIDQTDLPETATPVVVTPGESGS